MFLKKAIREILVFFHLDITKNLKYDRLTKLIIKRTINSKSICIDVGCHKGEILDLILKQSPNGQHYGFEPIPYLYENLKKKYSSKNHILPFALADNEGSTTFQFVKNAPAYSGFKKRDYAINNPDIEELEVQMKTLDSIIPISVKIDFIKIDVEGAELGVLKGSKRILSENKPIVIFEFGLGASNYYGTQPETIYDFIHSTGLKISLLDSWLKNKPSLKKLTFNELYFKNKEYYFIAHP